MEPFSNRRIKDEVLLSQIASGSENAMTELYNRYSQRMYQYFYRMLGRDAILAEDFVQDLFLKVIHKAHTFDTSRKFSTWLYAVAGNMCKNEYRHRERHKRPFPLTEVHEACLYAEEPEQILDILDKNQFDEHLLQVIDSLEPHHRNGFVLRYQEGLSIKEIADIEGCPEGTVKSRIHYATRKIAEKMKIYHPDYQVKRHGA